MANRNMPAPRILHLHSTFDLGGKEARAVRLMNAFGDRYGHDIVSAVPSALGAMDAIDPGIDAKPLTYFPDLQGRPFPKRLQTLAYAMDEGGYALTLTYNFGAMDAVLARRRYGTTPLVHHEDGFNQDERKRQKGTRVAYRRLALPAATNLVVPSQTLETIALAEWKQPRDRVVRISNGIDVSRFGKAPAADAIPGLERREGEVIVGTLAGLRPIKNLPRLIKAFALALKTVKTPSRLVIVGDGPDRARIREVASQAGVIDHVIMPGFLPDPSKYVGLFDIFALSSDSEQFPISLVEAMSAKLPAATTDVGDISNILPDEQREFVTELTPPALASALARLIDDAGFRARLGAANRAKVAADYDERVMIDRYARLYEGAMAGHEKPGRQR
ncbi:MAG: glycosyltransferase family 4 protein [Pacificimonas sp.]